MITLIVMRWAAAVGVIFLCAHMVFVTAAEHAGPDRSTAARYEMARLAGWLCVGFLTLAALAALIHWWPSNWHPFVLWRFMP